jgi:hypothetical protein
LNCLSWDWPLYFLLRLVGVSLMVCSWTAGRVVRGPLAHNAPARQ